MFIPNKSNFSRFVMFDVFWAWSPCNFSPKTWFSDVVCPCSAKNNRRPSHQSTKNPYTKNIFAQSKKSVEQSEQLSGNGGCLAHNSNACYFNNCVCVFIGLVPFWSWWRLLGFVFGFYVKLACDHSMFHIATDLCSAAGEQKSCEFKFF